MSVTLADVQAEYQQEFPDGESSRSLRGIEHLKSMALTRGLHESCLRSLAWKIFLGALPPLMSPDQWANHITAQRNEYAQLVDKHITKVKDATKGQELDANTHNPLDGAAAAENQDEDSPWTAYYHLSEVEDEVNKDVERTFPDVEFFRNQQVQELMHRVLTVFALTHPEVSYKQGMHEVLAPLVFVLAREMLATDTSSAFAVQFNSGYVEHDAHTLFTIIMSTLAPWYISIQRQRGQRPSPDDPQSALIVHANYIQNELLRKVDPELFHHLEKEGVEPQLYCMKWLRLLVGREFHLEDVLKIWDALFADGPDLSLVDHLVVAMLLYVREALMEADYSFILRRLFKYPPVEDVMVLVAAAERQRQDPSSGSMVPPVRADSGVTTGSSGSSALAGHCGKYLDNAITILQKELLGEGSPDPDTSFLVLAELKRIRDVLSGDIDESLLHGSLLAHLTQNKESSSAPSPPQVKEAVKVAEPVAAAPTTLSAPTPSPPSGIRVPAPLGVTDGDFSFEDDTKKKRKKSKKKVEEEAVAPKNMFENVEETDDWAPTAARKRKPKKKKVNTTLENLDAQIEGDVDIML